MAACGTCGVDVRPVDNFCGVCGAGQDDLAGASSATRSAAATTSGTAPTDPAPRMPLFSQAFPDGAGEPGEATPADAQVVEVPVDEEPTSTSLDHAAASGAPTALIATTGGVDLVTCGACDAVNAAQRARCARCGEPLGERSSTEDEWELNELSTSSDEDAVSAAPEAPRPRRIPTWAWVVAVGILVGGGIGLATALGIGPLAAPTGPGVTFRAQAYPEAPDLLGPDLLGSSEVRPDEGGRSFVASQLLDADPTTIWSPVEPDDAVVTFRFESPVWITAIEVANGDQSGPDEFEATGRVRVAEVEMGRGQRLRATLIDGDGRQVVRFPSPALTTQAKVVVSEVTGGTGVALADVAIIGHEASPRDTAAYREGQ